MSEIRIGISGWTYEGWRGSFYPATHPQSQELEFASRQFSTIEINGTFYSLQKPSSFASWYERTPDNFVFSVKANRYITHVRKLNNVRAPMANFLSSGPLALKEKLGPFLWQFPPSLGFDPERFDAFFKLLPRDTDECRSLIRHADLSPHRRYKGKVHPAELQHAVEVRHVSFLDPAFVDLARAYNVALVYADTAGRWPYLEDITAPFIYVRLHGDSELYVSGYNDPTLDFWAHRIKTWARGRQTPDQMRLVDADVLRNPRNVYVYFDNDAKVRAPVDAHALQKRIGKVFGAKLAS